MSLSYSHDHLGSDWYRSEGPLFLKPVTGQELFLAVSYSKPAQIAPLPPPDFRNFLRPCFYTQTDAVSDDSLC